MDEQEKTTIEKPLEEEATNYVCADGSNASGEGEEENNNASPKGEVNVDNADSIDGGATAYYVQERQKSDLQQPLIIALLGLMGAFFYGAGGILSVIAIILGASRMRLSNKSQTLKWAVLIGVLGLVLSLAYLLCLSYFGFDFITEE